MATATQNQVSDFAYQAGLRGQESMTCPRSYRGWVIPEMFEDGVMAFGIWRHFYAEGLEQAARMNYITTGQVKKLGEALEKNGYGQYLLDLVRDA